MTERAKNYAPALPPTECANLPEKSDHLARGVWILQRRTL